MSLFYIAILLLCSRKGVNTFQMMSFWFYLRNGCLDCQLWTSSTHIWLMFLFHTPWKPPCPCFQVVIKWKHCLEMDQVFNLSSCETAGVWLKNKWSSLFCFVLFFFLEKLFFIEILQFESNFFQKEIFLVRDRLQISHLIFNQFKELN